MQIALNLACKPSYCCICQFCNRVLIENLKKLIGKPRKRWVFHRMNTSDHQMICEKRDKNLSQPLNSPLIAQLNGMTMNAMTLENTTQNMIFSVRYTKYERIH